jgi:hypothetical protein
MGGSVKFLLKANGPWHLHMGFYFFLLLLLQLLILPLIADLFKDARVSQPPPLPAMATHAAGLADSACIGSKLDSASMFSGM